MQPIERTRGVYDFAATDPFFAQLAARKLGLIAILGDWNPLYSAGPEEIGPHLTNASSIAAFARFGRAVAARYSRDEVLLELINEPNTGGGYTNASLYAEVALAAGSAIHSAGGKVAAPALAGPDASWLQVTLDAGLLSVVVRFGCCPPTAYCTCYRCCCAIQLIRDDGCNGDAVTALATPLFTGHSNTAPIPLDGA